MNASMSELGLSLFASPDWRNFDLRRYLTFIFIKIIFNSACPTITFDYKLSGGTLNPQILHSYDPSSEYLLVTGGGVMLLLRCVTVTGVFTRYNKVSSSL